MRTVLGIATLALVEAAPPPRERIVAIDTTLPVVIERAAGRMRIDPGAPGRPVLTPDYAGRARLRGGGDVLKYSYRLLYQIGREQVRARTRFVTLKVDGGGPQYLHAIWAPHAFAAGADVVMGPAGLAEPVVRFVLRPPIAGERTVVIPIAPATGMFGVWSEMAGEVHVGVLPLSVRFAPYLATSVVTASTAMQLAETLGGRMTERTGSAEIAFGVWRPVRGMVLTQPLAIGPLRLGEVAVRTADIGSVNGLPTTADAAADPDEIVVVARGKRAPGSMTLGADYLRRCSSIVFDKPASVIRLTCA